MNTLNRCRCGCGSKTNLDHRGQPRSYLKGHSRRGTGKGWIENHYRYISVDGKKIGEHRYIVEQREGRKLRRDEVVHHLNEHMLDNRPENLVAVTRAEHRRLHAGRKWKRWSPEEKARARQLHAEGMTIQDTARAMGRSVRSTITHVCSPRQSTRAKVPRAS